MTPAIDITTAQRKTLLTLLRQFIPGVTVWAYGSRVKWTARPNSDLDLVAFTTPAQNPRVSELKEALAESNLPFPVDMHVWDEIPGRFHAIIRNEYVVLQEAEEKQQRDVSGWQTIHLGSACKKIGSGATPRGGSEVYQTTGISLIRSQNIYNDGFKRDGLAFIGDKHARELENVNVLPGDVLLNITGDSVARVCQVPGEILPARVNQHVAIIRPKKNILDARFLHYFLIHPQTQAHMLGLAGAGATRNALTKGMIESFEIKAPSFSEQRAIAAVLGSLDDKIELNRRMNETLEALAQSLFKSWFVDATQSALPKGWRETTLNELAAISGGKQLPTEECKPSGKFTVFGANGIMGYADRATHEGFVIAFGRVGAYCGSIHWAHGGAWINNNASSVVPHRWPEFVLQAMLNVDFASMRTGSAQPFIPNSALSAAKTIRPTDDILDSYCSIVRPLRLKQTQNEAESRTLAALRDALLPKLLSGELRVANAVEIGGGTA